MVLDLLEHAQGVLERDPALHHPLGDGEQRRARHLVAILADGDEHPEALRASEDARRIGGRDMEAPAELGECQLLRGLGRPGGGERLAKAREPLGGPGRVVEQALDARQVEPIIL
jgi:hypothetical protein